MSDFDPASPPPPPLTIATDPATVDQLLRSAADPAAALAQLLALDPGLCLAAVLRTRSAGEGLDAFRSFDHLSRATLRLPSLSWLAEQCSLAHAEPAHPARQRYNQLSRRAQLAGALLVRWAARDRLPSARAEGVALRASTLAAVSIAAEHAAPAGVAAQLAAWPAAAARLFDDATRQSLAPPALDDDPAGLALVIADALAAGAACEQLARKLPEWARRLGGGCEALADDIAAARAEVEGAGEFGARALIGGEAAIAHSSDCRPCRQRAFDNAMDTVRRRLANGQLGLVELIDHCLHAMIHCGGLRRAQWWQWVRGEGVLRSRLNRAVQGHQRAPLQSLRVEEQPLFQVLLERPRSLQLYPGIGARLAPLLPADGGAVLGEHALVASLFCGEVPIGVLVADADGGPIGAAEAARFRLLAQLATKIATLLALRVDRRLPQRDAAALEYPGDAALQARLMRRIGSDDAALGPALNRAPVPASVS